MVDLFVEMHAEEIGAAAASFDGHVTNGSLAALLVVIARIRAESKREVFRAIHEMTYKVPTCADALIEIGKMYGEFIKDNPE